LASATVPLRGHGGHSNSCENSYKRRQHIELGIEPSSFKTACGAIQTRKEMHSLLLYHEGAGVIEDCGVDLAVKCSVELASYIHVAIYLVNALLCLRFAAKSRLLPYTVAFGFELDFPRAETPYCSRV
jgi:hypothetical protein